MLIYHRTSILDSQAQVAVNTVNCVGVMGKGLAHKYKQRYPEMYSRYKTICDRKLLEPGKLWLWKGEDQWVLNFPTKIHWRNASRTDWIEAGLTKFTQTFEEKEVTHISFPKLGCGNGGLDWESTVKPIMEKHLSDLPIEVWIHDHEAPIGIPEHIEAATKSALNISPPRSKEEFWSSLVSASEQIGYQLKDFETNENFKISANDGILALEAKDLRSFYTKDEMTDAWKILCRGMLTKKKLGINRNEEASKIVSIFGSLPYASPVNIAPFYANNNQVAAQLSKLNQSDAPDLFR